MSDLTIAEEWLADAAGATCECTRCRMARSVLRNHALIRRAHDAMSRREPDGVSTAEWDQLLADMAKELGVADA